MFTPIAEFLGFSGLVIGDHEFERKYTIKSSNEPRGRSLMTDRRLREMIIGEPSLRLEIGRLSWGKRRKMGDGVRVVTAGTVGVIKEPDRLVDYVLLVTTTLDRLLRIGGASKESLAEGRMYPLGRRV